MNTKTKSFLKGLLVSTVMVAMIGSLYLFGGILFPQSGIVVPTLAATNAPTFYDITDPFNNQYREGLWVGTCSTSSPETFSIYVGEQTDIWGSWDRFIITYEISTTTHEWVIETNYTHTQTNPVSYPGIRDSLQATITGADASSPFIVKGENYYRYGNP